MDSERAVSQAQLVDTHTVLRRGLIGQNKWKHLHELSLSSGTLNSQSCQGTNLTVCRKCVHTVCVPVCMNAHVTACAWESACLSLRLCVYVYMHWSRASECILGLFLIRHPESGLALFSLEGKCFLVPFHFTLATFFFHFVSPLPDCRGQRNQCPSKCGVSITTRPNQNDTDEGWRTDVGKCGKGQLWLWRGREQGQIWVALTVHWNIAQSAVPSSV